MFQGLPVFFPACAANFEVPTRSGRASATAGRSCRGDLFRISRHNLIQQFQVAERILACYILFALYAPHPIKLNPFASVLHTIFVKETERAQGLESAGGVADNDQLVYVLWKILKGDGNDVSSCSLAFFYSPLSFRIDQSIFTSSHPPPPNSSRVACCGSLERCRCKKLAI